MKILLTAFSVLSGYDISDNHFILVLIKHLINNKDRMTQSTNSAEHSPKIQNI